MHSRFGRNKSRDSAPQYSDKRVYVWLKREITLICFVHAARNLIGRTTNNKSQDSIVSFSKRAHLQRIIFSTRTERTRI
jgi:hypothetical protein